MPTLSLRKVATQGLHSSPSGSCPGSVGKPALPLLPSSKVGRMSFHHGILQMGCINTPEPKNVFRGTGLRCCRAREFHGDYQTGGSRGPVRAGITSSAEQNKRGSRRHIPTLPLSYCWYRDCSSCPLPSVLLCPQPCPQPLDSELDDTTAFLGSSLQMADGEILSLHPYAADSLLYTSTHTHTHTHAILVLVLWGPLTIPHGVADLYRAIRS